MDGGSRETTLDGSDGGWGDVVLDGRVWSRAAKGRKGDAQRGGRRPLVLHGRRRSRRSEKSMRNGLRDRRKSDRDSRRRRQRVRCGWTQGSPAWEGPAPQADEQRGHRDGNTGKTGRRSDDLPGLGEVAVTRETGGRWRTTGRCTARPSSEADRRTSCSRSEREEGS